MSSTVIYRPPPRHCPWIYLIVTIIVKKQGLLCPDPSFLLMVDIFFIFEVPPFDTTLCGHDLHDALYFEPIWWLWWLPGTGARCLSSVRLTTICIIYVVCSGLPAVSQPCLDCNRYAGTGPPYKESIESGWLTSPTWGDNTSHRFADFVGASVPVEISLLHKQYCRQLRLVTYYSSWVTAAPGIPRTYAESLGIA